MTVRAVAVAVAVAADPTSRVALAAALSAGNDGVSDPSPPHGPQPVDAHV